MTLERREIVMSIEELDATRAERWGHADEIATERFRGVQLVAVCERCGGRIHQNGAGFYVHTEPSTDCAVPTLTFRESRL